jgi:Uma2 family endonuclease
MIKAASEKLYNVEEYFELEKNSEIRHEYYYGKLISMPGESKIANQISKNILKKWDDSLENQGYCLYNHDVKAEVVKKGVYRYPDIVVSPETDDSDIYLVKQPVIMVEVASEESWKRDTHNKRKEYTALPTMKYYMVVSQEEMYVELYYRKGQDWILKQFEEAEDTIILTDFNLKIELSEVYHRVKFGEQKTDESSML